MKFTQAFRLALKSMATSKMRSFLTMLGIIIGVAAVITLVSIVGGFSNTMTDSFESMGTNLINVSLRGRAGNMAIDADDMFGFAEENRDIISYISPSVTLTATVKNGTNNLTSTVYGVSEDYMDIKSYEVQSGRFISYMDSHARKKVCVLGTYIANELYGGPAQAMNQSIKINGESYTIVGVLSETQGSTQGGADDMLIVPYTSASRLSRTGVISSYQLNARTTEDIPAAMIAVKEFLYSVYEDENAYTVLSMEEAVDKINELTGMLTMILVGIAAISLLVGGIGIMNIMLVSVTERTREIGIRKALGGKRRDILMQFLIEAATTSGLGGVIGIVFGCTAAYILANMIGISAAFSVPAIAASFSVSVAIGVGFGYFPAAKASSFSTAMTSS